MVIELSGDPVPVCSSTDLVRSFILTKLSPFEQPTAETHDMNPSLGLSLSHTS